MRIGWGMDEEFNEGREEGGREGGREERSKRTSRPRMKESMCLRQRAS